MTPARMKARVVYSPVAARFVGEVVTPDGALVVAFFRNTWDGAMNAAKAYVSQAKP